MPTWYGYGLDAYGLSPYGSVWQRTYVRDTADYELLYGYEVKWEPTDRTGWFPLNTDVVVISSAANEARKRNTATAYYKFKVRGLVQCNLPVFITGVPGTPTANLGASLSVNSPHYEWGKTMTLVFEAADHAGNKLGPVTISYVLENRS